MIRYKNQIGIVFAWLSALLFCIFSIMALTHPGIRDSALHKRSFIAGLGGCSIMFNAFSAVPASYLLAARWTPLIDGGRLGMMIFEITSAIAFLCLFAFFGSFARAGLPD